MTERDHAAWAEFLREKYGIADPIAPESPDDLDDEVA